LKIDTIIASKEHKTKSIYLQPCSRRHSATNHNVYNGNRNNHFYTEIHC